MLFGPCTATLYCELTRTDAINGTEVSFLFANKTHLMLRRFLGQAAKIVNRSYEQISFALQNIHKK